MAQTTLGYLQLWHMTIFCASVVASVHFLTVRALEVQNYMFTYHIERQFHFMFMLYYLGLISIFLYVRCVQISCGPLPTHFLNFHIKLLLSKKVKFQIHVKANPPM